jgi:hypothetical protein
MLESMLENLTIVITNIDIITNSDQNGQTRNDEAEWIDENITTLLNKLKKAAEHTSDSITKLTLVIENIIILLKR